MRQICQGCGFHYGRLKPRTLRMVILACQGKTNPEIAKFFGISESVIKQKFLRLYKAMEFPAFAGARSSLLGWVLKHHWLDLIVKRA